MLAHLTAGLKEAHLSLLKTKTKKQKPSQKQTNKTKKPCS